MKKFYYKKEDTVEKTPMILERRNTISKDLKEEAENRLSTRTSSLGSVDQLRDVKLIPRVQNREITKCLSEDVLNRCYMKNPGKVITERELAASRLYKTRKASINSRDSPQKVSQSDGLSPVKLTDPKYRPIPVPPKGGHKRDPSCLFPQQVLTQKNDLSPVTLKDPKFKPVPVPPKDRRKRNSTCLCYLGIFMVISLCTVGFLAAVTGLLFGEIFGDKNSTSHRLQESITGVANSVETDSSVHEYHPLTNRTSYRKISFESDSNEIRRSGSSLIDSKNTNAVQFRQMDMVDLGRLLDDKKAEIKFQDRDTTIVEVNTSGSVEQVNDVDDDLEVIEKAELTNDAEINMFEADGPDIINIEHISDDRSIIKVEKLEEIVSPSILDDARQRDNIGVITNTKIEIHDPTADIEQTHTLYTDSNIKETDFPISESEKEEIDGSRSLNIMKQDIDDLKTISKYLENDNVENIMLENFEASDKKTEVTEGKTKHIDGPVNLLSNTLNDSSDTDLKLSDEKQSEGIQDHSSSSVMDSESRNQPESISDNIDEVYGKSIPEPSLKLNDVNFEYKTMNASSPKDKVVWKAVDPIQESSVDDESDELVGKEISGENLGTNAVNRTEHDVEEILEVISEPADSELDTFTEIRRNGDIDVVSGTSNVWVKHNLNQDGVERGDGDSSAQLRAESQNSQKNPTPKETLRVKTSNMKVSLAEAMKHLQTLDFTNKVLTSRMKSAGGNKPKAQKAKPPKLNNKQRTRENISADRMKYLHNLRLALQGNLIGM